MEMLNFDKSLNRSQTINIIVFIFHSIGIRYNTIAFNHVAFLLTIISFIFLLTGFKKERERENGKIRMCPFIKGFVFCVFSFSLWILSLYLTIGHDAIVQI